MTITAPKLTDWFVENQPSDNLIWKNGLSEQVLFVRDMLHPLLVPVYEHRKHQPVRVVSTHRSKSVVLPVFQLNTPGFGLSDYGLNARLRLRYNFFNWVVSVETTRLGGINDRFHDLFNREAAVHHVYAEGFQEDWVFGAYADDRKKFTLQLHSRYELYTFCWLMKVGST